jgi:Protein of unknown function DUF58
MAWPLVNRWWRNADRAGWRHFGVAMGTLSVALLLLGLSGMLSDAGSPWLAAAAVLGALALAGWVALAIVPQLARRTSLRWLVYQVDYRLTREGMIYLGVILVLVLTSVNTGNNLLFLVLSCLLAGILVSGVLSRATLGGIDLKFALPEHIFAGQPLMTMIELTNQKEMWPSFSLRVVGLDSGSPAGTQILTRPVYFPHVAHLSAARQNVELLFPRRGIYRQDAFGIRTKFPFGFLEKTRRVENPLELVVYPAVEPTEEFFEILPLLSGEMASFFRGRGYELYSIREYEYADSARQVDWKATAKTGGLKVREFTREDERRVVLVFDPCVPPVPTSNRWPDGSPQAPAAGAQAGARAVQDMPGAMLSAEHPRENSISIEGQRFERAVSLVACIAWHFYEVDAVMQFCTNRMATPVAAAAEIIYDALRELALVQPETSTQAGAFLDALAAEPDVFKIILTSRPRGSIPTALWSSSYFIFMDSLQI